MKCVHALVAIEGSEDYVAGAQASDMGDENNKEEGRMDKVETSDTPVWSLRTPTAEQMLGRYP